MPYNRTRTWVGVAIVAVTIPAIGNFYHRETTKTLHGEPVTAANRADLTDGQTASFGTRGASVGSKVRDYDAEIATALARQGATVTPEPFPGGEDDPTFDVAPFDAADDEPPTVADEAAPRVVNVAPPLPQGALPDDPLPPDATVADAVVQDTQSFDQTGMPNLSDRAIYTMIVNDLSGEERDRFVQAYAAMSPAQRAEMLDGFRAQIEDES